MKVRIGVSTSTPLGDQLGDFVVAMESLGFDSLWLADVTSLPGDEPITGLSYAAGCARKLKLGTTLVLPGRNPVRLAKQMATLDQLSNGRLLLTLVLGLNLQRELSALAVDKAQRAELVDEGLPLLRRLWAEDEVDHQGKHWSFEAVSVHPKPKQNPFDVWLGGTLPSALRRVGELADGWLPSLCAPEEAKAGREIIERHAQASGRTISDEHYGVSIGYLPEDSAIPDRLVERIKRSRPGSDVELDTLVPRGLEALRRLIGKFVDVGFSKFVVRSAVPTGPRHDELHSLADAVLDLQT